MGLRRRMGVVTTEFEEAAERHLDDVHAFLVYLTGDRNVAEELTAETFARACERWRRYDPRRGSARTWLCQLARSTALDHFRAEDRRRRREGRYAVGVPEAQEAGFGEGLSPRSRRRCRGCRPQSVKCWRFGSSSSSTAKARAACSGSAGPRARRVSAAPCRSWNGR